MSGKREHALVRRMTGKTLVCLSDSDIDRIARRVAELLLATVVR